jgi:hypothetical protein
MASNDRASTRTSFASAAAMRGSISSRRVSIEPAEQSARILHRPLLPAQRSVEREFLPAALARRVTALPPARAGKQAGKFVLII